MPRRPLLRRLAAESLETRHLLAGNVQLLGGASLTIRGDRWDNQIEITQPDPDTLRVTGLDGTTVNGQEFREIPCVARNLSIQMQQGGVDQVEIAGPFHLRGDLRARFGQGQFILEGSEGPITIGDELSIKSVKGTDVTLVNEVRVGGETDIRVGGEVVVISGRATVHELASASFSNELNINNPYFPLVPGTSYVNAVQGIDPDTHLPFTEEILLDVLSDTKTILGIEARVVRDRVFLEGVLIEDTFDWYAQDDNGNVWYLGEDVTNFRFDDNGNPLGTDKDGSWEAGVDNAVAGIIMEAQPQVGDRYYQEFQPGGVVDQGLIVALGEMFTVPAGSFKNVLRTRDTSVREPFDRGEKFYAPGLGHLGEIKFDIETNEIVQTNELVSVTLNGAPVTQVVSPTGFVGINPAGTARGGVEVGDEVIIQASGRVTLNGVTLQDELSITSKAEVLVMESQVPDTLSIRAGDNVSLRDVVTQDTVTIRGDVDVHLFDVDLVRLTIRQGAGDNRLVVEGSVIDRILADGGRGANTFENLGGNTLGTLRLSRLK